MTTTRMPRSGSLPAVRRAALVLLAGAGVALSPLPAQAAAGGGGPSSAAVAAAPAAAAASSAAQTVVSTALAQKGKPYVWAGAGPNSYDCSGLTQRAFAAAGVKLPHSSRMQSKMGAPVSRNALRPGDLVFFYNPVSHVGIYIGNGQMVHAPRAGDVVKVSSFDRMPGFHSARRLA
ncbi:C40 family peptidase [Blastococcus mobilis]|uniref:Cell wall-associated hydrolase, NlpC family n=1 Tax=Blastococcus mobilis TaxID=1938746 RepID=A0A238VBL0_9ACTN|nr:Cell wall-associated hydrolase, NlpC family [Blastococcus mobilis]